MARLRVDFFSEQLQMGTAMTVLLPQRTSAQIGLATAATPGPPPVLYLLHGLSDDDTAWSRWTSVERYAADRGLAVVMPQVHRSFYTDERHGHRFFSFLADELPGIVQDFFRVSDRREDTFVAGLSMGGYGAFSWALRRPDRFAAAASLSGVLDVAGLMDRPERDELRHRVFGDGELAGSDADLLRLVAEADPASLPELWLSCGDDDALRDGNVLFRDRCRARGIRLDAHFGPGDHEWGYWDARIRDVVRWLPIGGVS
jgi:S-formylglutathione hydrolase FrmB